MDKLSRRDVLKLGAAGGGALALGGVTHRGARFRARAQADEIKIGLLAPVTGVFADFGDLMRKATDLAVQKVNAEGGASSTASFASSRRMTRGSRRSRRSALASSSSKTRSTS